MSGAITPLPKYDFMAWCLVKHRASLVSFFVSSTLSLVTLVSREGRGKSKGKIIPLSLVWNHF